MDATSTVETVYSSVYIVVYIQSFYIVVYIVVHVYIYMTGARMGSQRQPTRLQRTHETWAMCHLSGPEIWECGQWLM